MECDESRATLVNRRDMILGVGAIASVAVSGTAWASDAHDHAGHAHVHSTLVDALANCTASGEVCVSHCLATFAEGDTALAACAAKVQEMLAVCSALSHLAASNSSHFGDMAKVCSTVCEDCSKQCNEHADKHAAYRNCMEACDAVVAELKKGTA
jgi:Cys-rich four helix bundle protein (predicted Tat secretion target)